MIIHERSRMYSDVWDSTFYEMLPSKIKEKKIKKDVQSSEIPCYFSSTQQHSFFILYMHHFPLHVSVLYTDESKLSSLLSTGYDVAGMNMYCKYQTTFLIK